MLWFVLDYIVKGVPDILSSLCRHAALHKLWMSASVLIISYEWDTDTCSEALKNRLDV